MGEWTEVPLGIEAGSEQLTGDQIVYGTAGFLAVGTRYGFTEGGPFPAQRYLWHSPDGRAWSGLPFPTEFGEVFLEALSTAANGDYTMYLSRTVTAGRRRSCSDCAPQMASPGGVRSRIAWLPFRPGDRGRA